MRSQKNVLHDLNKDVPSGIDWHAGAQRYVNYYSAELGKDAVEHYALTKPLVHMSRDSHYHRDLEENISYLYNFVNMLNLLWLPGGANILDAACGGGWVSHFLTRMGYATFGFDISPEYISLARQRIRNDPRAWIPDDKIDGMFAVHNIETTALAAKHFNRYDAIVLESCLHHFVDPIAALKNLVPCLKDDGVLFVIEGENRSGAFREEHLNEMLKTETLERSFPRALLEEIYTLSGVPNFEFFGDLNGWYSSKDPSSRKLIALLDERSRLRNLSICAKSADVLDKRFGWRVSNETAVAIPYSGLDDDPGEGWRWSGPFSEIKICRAVGSLDIAIRSEVPRLLGRTQEVFAHGPKGLLGRVVLSADAPHAQFHLSALNAGDTVSFSSGDFFVPAQLEATPDERRLAFALRLPSD